MQIVINGLLTNYQIANSGNKKTLLILHGWGQNSTHWQSISNSLPKNITIIALDLPTFGSTQPLPNTPGVAEYAIFVKSFIDKLKLKNIFLLGHSFGGQIAVDLSLRYPKLFNHLILVSPASTRHITPNIKSKLNKILKPLAKLLPVQLHNSLLQLTASKNYYDSSPTQRKILKKIVYQDYTARLKDIHTPTSIIWGEKDNTIVNDSKLLANKIQNSKLFVIYGADHNPHLLATSKLSTILNTILKSNV